MSLWTQPSSLTGPLAVPRTWRLPAWEQFRYLTRPRRILLVLAATWVIHIFDLGFTLLETYSDHFHETNPIAARFLHSANAIIAYKFILLGFGTTVMLALRRHVLAEWGSWLMLASSVYVAIRWYCYYICVASGVHNPFIVIE